MSRDAEEPPYLTADFEPRTLAEALYALAYSAGMIGLGADHRPAWKHAQQAAVMLEARRSSPAETTK